MEEYSIKRELDAGEKILWQGKPKQGIIFRALDILYIPFSVMWCGGAIAWMSGVLSITAKSQNHAAKLLPLFGIPFVLVGLYIMIGRFFVDAKIRANTDYAVTNERIIIASGFSGRKIKSLSLKTLPVISLSEKPDGHGTLAFGDLTQFATGARASGYWPGAASPSIFEMIPNVRDVETIIRKAQREAV